LASDKDYQLNQADCQASWAAQHPEYWKMYRASRQSSGGIMQKAMGAIENALLDIKAKDLGVPVHGLMGGPTRKEIRAYWSHCGTSRVRNPEHLSCEPITDLDGIADLGREVVRKGYTALKTNVLWGKRLQVLMQGYRGGYGTTDLNISNEILGSLKDLMETFRGAVGDRTDICLDLNFHLRTEGNIRVARALEEYGLMWLELDTFNAKSLRAVRESSPIPICSGENLFTSRGYREFFERQAMDVASIDVLWNGFAQSKKIADLAEIHDMNVAPHNHYSHLATAISAQFCAAIPNARIFEVDIDDVPWKDELVKKAPKIESGMLQIPDGPGWGMDLDEDAIKAHPLKEKS